MSISYEHIAHDLLRSIDALIATLADDPLLHAALRRERTRLQNHLQNQLVDSQPFEMRSNRALRRAGQGVRRRLRHGLGTLRGVLYQAVASGLLSAPRFDAVMLLA